MGSAPSDDPGGVLAAFKIVVAGGFGAGKTTLVGAVSEVQPLCTEEDLSQASVGLDDLSGVNAKTTTTVAMDFGRLTLSDSLVLYLFGTPGQERFWFMWDELSYGALGAVILADTRRLDDCFPSVDYFEKCQLPFVVAINCFSDSPRYDLADIRVALDLGPITPVMLCDARDHGSVKQVLITLVEHVLAVGSSSPAAGDESSAAQHEPLAPPQWSAPADADEAAPNPDEPAGSPAAPGPDESAEPSASSRDESAEPPASSRDESAEPSASGQNEPAEPPAPGPDKSAEPLVSSRDEPAEPPAPDPDDSAEPPALGPDESAESPAPEVSVIARSAREKPSGRGPLSRWLAPR